MSDDRHGLLRDRRRWGVEPESMPTCPLCDQPAVVQEMRGPAGPTYRLLVLCDRCSIYFLTRSAEYLLRTKPSGRAVLADRARRIFGATGEPIEVDVAAIEAVTELLRDIPAS